MLHKVEVIYVRGTTTWTERIDGSRYAFKVVGAELGARYAIYPWAGVFQVARCSKWASNDDVDVAFEHADRDAALMWAIMKGDDDAA